jgi:GNAT superfamily N-acetyltransferase
MKFRLATMQDIGQIVAMGCGAYYASAYAKQFGNFNTYEAQLELAKYIADREDSFVMIAETDKGVLGGFLVGTVARLPFASTCYASDVAFVARGGVGVKLLRGFLAWARERALPVMMANGFGDPRVDKLYEAHGLKTVGGLHMGVGK